MKSSLFGDFFSNLLATFLTTTVKDLEIQQNEFIENTFNQNINLEKINDLKNLCAMYIKLAENRNSSIAKYHLRQTKALLKCLEKKESSNLNTEIYEIQAHLNLAYLALNPYRG